MPRRGDPTSPGKVQDTFATGSDKSRLPCLGCGAYLVLVHLSFHQPGPFKVVLVPLYT